MKVYFISGLGADSRVFKNILLPEGYNAIHLEWIIPKKDELMKDYARRLAMQIDSGEPFILVGLSFGGMIATEISKQIEVVKTILISSIPLSSQLPFSYRLAAAIKLQKLVPTSILLSASVLKHQFSHEIKEESAMLVQMARSADRRFVNWAINTILSWRNEKIPANVYQIHGTKDKILPIRYTHPSHTIPHAGHFMVLNRSAEINFTLRSILSGN